MDGPSNNRFVVKSVLLAISVVFASVSSPAFAQSAEETVAFLLYGAENSRSFADVDSRVLFTESNKSPAVYSITKNPDVSGLKEISVSRQSDCIYVISRKGNSGRGSVQTVDFSKFTGFYRFDQFSILKFNDGCAVKIGDKCSDQSMVPPGWQADNARSDAALLYFKKSFCAGSAF